MTDCVNQAIAALQSDGRLDAITEQWLTSLANARSCNRSRTFPRPRWACVGGSRHVDLDPRPREPLPFHRRSDREQSARSLTVAIASPARLRRARLDHYEFARLGGRQGVVPRPRGLRRRASRCDRRVLDERALVPDRGGPHPGLRAGAGGRPRGAGTGAVPDAPDGHRLRRCVSRDPGPADHLRARVRGAGPADRGAQRPVLLGGRDPDACVLGVRLRGIPRRHRVGPPQPGRRGPVAWSQPAPVTPPS